MLVSKFPTGSKLETSQVTGLSVSAVANTPGSLSVSWTNPIHKKFSGVMVRYKTGAYPTSMTDGTLLYNSTGTSAAASGLTGGTTYYFRAFAYAKNKAGTKIVYNTDPANATAKTYSSPVTGLSVSAIANDTDSLKATWVAPAGSYSVIVVRCKTGGYPTSPTDGTSVFSGVGTTATINGLVAGTVYYFRAFVSNGSVYNNNSAGQQGYNTTYSNTITGFIVAKVSSTSLSASWVKPAGTYKQVMIRYKAGGYPTSISDGTQAYLGTGTSVTVGSLASGTTYYFRAFVSNSASVYNTNTTNQQANNVTKVAAGQLVFTSSQTWTVPVGLTKVDIFCVGGGGGGVNKDSSSVTNGYPDGNNGGCGGTTKSALNVAVIPGSSYSVVVGAGSAFPLDGTDLMIIAGGSSSFGTLSTAQGGQGAASVLSVAGGSGGGRGGLTNYIGKAGNGGSDGSNGYQNVNATYPSRAGQGTTTRAFGETSNTLYAGGGGGGGSHNAMNPTKAISRKGVNGAGGSAPNTGGGGYGASWHYASGKPVKSQAGQSGFSGVVIIRWPEQ